MSTRWIMLVASGLVLLYWPIPSRAQTAQQAAPGISQEEQKEQEEDEIEKAAKTPEGQQRLVQRLAQEFGVSESQITQLREKHLGYGEVRHVLSLAKQMPGGITQDNMNKILQMRQEDHLGWGKISQELLQTKLGSVVKEGSQTPATPTSPTAATQPQSLARPGQTAGNGENSRANGGGLHRNGGQALGSQAGLRPGGVGNGGFGGQRGNSGMAPGHNR